jgi:hypothetical protein
MAIKAIPAKQRKLIERIKANDGSPNQLFHDLTEITRRGDMNVMAEVVGLPVTKERKAYLFEQYFLHVGEPAAWPLLVGKKDESGMLGFLETIGRLGHPDAVAYLKKYASQGNSAMSGLVYLHEALTARGDTKKANEVASAIFHCLAEQKIDRFSTDKAAAIAMNFRLHSSSEGVRRRFPFHHFSGRSATNANAARLKDFGFLEEVSFYNAFIDDDGFRHLKHLRELKELHLGRTPITNRGIESLKDLKKLRVLDLLRTRITDAGLEHLAGLTRLEDLNLYSTKVTDTGLVSLKGLGKLEVLVLSDTKVTDAGLAHLAGLVQLKWLYLANTKVTDAGLVQLKGLDKLKQLYLNGTKVTDDGLMRLKGLAELEYLDLKQTQVTDAGVKELKKALPNCKINH